VGAGGRTRTSTSLKPARSSMPSTPAFENTTVWRGARYPLHDTPKMRCSSESLFEAIGVFDADVSILRLVLGRGE
jgi:hypothetical protein